MSDRPGRVRSSPMSRTGLLHQINISDGGVPKTPVPSAEVGPRGVVGDRQADRTHHGSRDQALCLYSFELIEALRAEGHPIYPGATGENLTIAGFEWSSIGPGTTFCIGDTVEAEATWPAAPCSKNAGWFIGRDFRRMSEDQHPGWSRWYARVMVTGWVETGMPVIIS